MNEDPTVEISVSLVEFLFEELTRQCAMSFAEDQLYSLRERKEASRYISSNTQVLSDLVNEVLAVYRKAKSEELVDWDIDEAFAVLLEEMEANEEDDA